MSKPSSRSAPKPAKAAVLPVETNPWQAAAPGFLIALLVFVAYLPALRGQFIWDDDFYITKNAALRSVSGLIRIWFVPGATPQYYPLVHTTFWLDYHLWGSHPMAYHLENVMLHAIGAILLWQLLRRLQVKGGWLGAALFALHPVCVESVAWITERKNTLSGVFFMLSMFAALEFWLPRKAAAAAADGKPSGTAVAIFGPWKFYWFALALYLCALWSKTAVVGLPGVILVLVWWKRRRLVWKDGLLVLPFLAVGMALSLITVSIERHYIVTASNADEWRLSLLDRFLIAGRGFWFYLDKIFWPHPLMFLYPRWKIEAASWPGYAALGAIAVLLLILWWKRLTWARPVLVAGAYYVILLFPALGFINIYPFRYSFVADHFQYLATIGPLVLAAAGITLMLTRLPVKHVLLRPAVIGVLLSVLGLLTWRQTGVYQNLETLWRDTLAHNPNAWMAHDNLGIYLSENHRFEEADEHYHQAIELRPNDHIAYYDLGLESAIKGDLDQATQYFGKSLEICPDYALAHYQLGNLLVRKGDFDRAISEYTNALQAIPNLAIGHFNLANALVKKGRLDEAIAAYGRTLELEPDYAPAHVRIGLVLTARGKVDEAIVHYREALETDPNSVDALANLANGLVSKGQLDEAVDYYRQALQLNPTSHVLHYNLSVALNRQGKTAEAQEEWAEAKRLEAQKPSVE